LDLTSAALQSNSQHKICSEWLSFCSRPLPKFVPEFAAKALRMPFVFSPKIVCFLILYLLLIILPIFPISDLVPCVKCLTVQSNAIPIPTTTAAKSQRLRDIQKRRRALTVPSSANNLLVKGEN
jgi:hypothetical protein